MLQEERAVERLQNEGLRVGMRHVVIGLDGERRNFNEIDFLLQKFGMSEQLKHIFHSFCL